MLSQGIIRRTARAGALAAGVLAVVVMAAPLRADVTAPGAPSATAVTVQAPAVPAHAPVQPMPTLAETATATATGNTPAASTMVAVTNAGFAYGLAAVISFGVAFMIKGLEAGLKTMTAHSEEL